MGYTRETLLIEEGKGEPGGSGTLIKARAAQLGGDFSIMEAGLEPDQLLAPHSHVHEDQCVFIIEGELEFEVGGEGGARFTASTGSYVIKPRGVSHCFWNKGSRRVRYIELSGRDGFEKFVDSTKEGAIKASLESERKYGLKFYPERIPGLLKKHGLTSVAGVTMPWDKA